MAKWAVQDAKARFSELVEITLAHGPQTVTKRGVDTVVVVPVDEWERLKKGPERSALEILRGNGPYFELDLPPRSEWNLLTDRVNFDDE